MVAKIKIGKRIAGVLHYNENKVEEGLATCIAASGFGRESAELSFQEKLARFEGLMELNPKVKTNTVHISLNFDRSEKPGDDLLNRIAYAYMTKIGFGNQPFLVYRHNDAAHDHVHLVSTNIRADGSRIDLHNIGRDQSEKARKELEEEFSLVRAEDKRPAELQELNSVDIQKVVYGKSGTKRAINSIVSHVVTGYNYTTLTELNAALRQFNVLADRGREDTRMFEKKGLVYSILDQKGKKVGVPIKASMLSGKPTLAYLERRFFMNKVSRSLLKSNLKIHLEQVLQMPEVRSKIDFMKECRKTGIDVVFHQSNTGMTYGLTIVDHKQKAVFKGSDLGKEFSARALEERLSAERTDLQKRVGERAEQSLDAVSIRMEGEQQVMSLFTREPLHAKLEKHLRNFSGANQHNDSLPDTLFLPQWEDRQGPDPKLKRRRKRRQHR